MKIILGFRYLLIFPLDVHIVSFLFLVELKYTLGVILHVVQLQVHFFT